MERWYVSICHLTDAELEFLGYSVVRESDEFKIYRDYTGDEHIVQKNGKKFLYVEDLNDAVAMRSAFVIPAPDGA